MRLRWGPGDRSYFQEVRRWVMSTLATCLSLTSWSSLSAPHRGLGLPPATGSSGLTGCRGLYKHEPSLETVDQVNILSLHLSPPPLSLHPLLIPSPSLSVSRP